MNSVMPKYKRILLKLSGEALNGKTTDPIDSTALQQIAEDIVAASHLGIQIGIVIGGGNLFRGRSLAEVGLDRITGDQIGMLATVINALILRDALEKRGKIVRIMSALSIGKWVSEFDRYKAIRQLNKGYIVIFAGGTGNPLVSTDAAASLRGIEIGAEVLLKATQVDGVYSADPKKDKDAILYTHLTYKEVIEKELGVMDIAAFVQCRDQNLPIHVFNLQTPHALRTILQGGQVGTVVTN
ncbi:UMP kinase [Rickettsiella massiliensis]|uniref:UMP kinase n=1 Tax=Rickettsiella massiliensis TaxID=676517 RepID=UPI00029A0370|nr:UMP kinase [Rickettsiella massiliensis]